MSDFVLMSSSGFQVCKGDHEKNIVKVVNGTSLRWQQFKKIGRYSIHYTRVEENNRAIHTPHVIGD